MKATPRLATLLVCLGAAATLAGCAGHRAGHRAGHHGHHGKADAMARLAPTAAEAGMKVTGHVRFTALEHGVRIEGTVRGLKPGQAHGFHIHEKGDCGDNAEAAGGHFNPSGGIHGKAGEPGTHAGELPSLVADADGTARVRAELHNLSLTEGEANNAVGRALVVHRDRDDYTSQPAGNAGPRVACAVIESR